MSFEDEIYSDRVHTTLRNHYLHSRYRRQHEGGITIQSNYTANAWSNTVLIRTKIRLVIEAEQVIVRRYSIHIVTHRTGRLSPYQNFLPLRNSPTYTPPPPSPSPDTPIPVPIESVEEIESSA